VVAKKAIAKKRANIAGLAAINKKIAQMKRERRLDKATIIKYTTLAMQEYASGNQQ
jgi:hypothetical protein